MLTNYKRIKLIKENINLKKLILETKNYSKYDILIEANKAGLRHRKNGNFWLWETPLLAVSYELGLDGVSILNQPIVIGERYGKAPDTYVSMNYRDGIKEMGMSLSNLIEEEEVGSSMWFSDRKKYQYEGILSPEKGSDDEYLLLAFDFENYDGIDWI